MIRQKKKGRKIRKQRTLRKKKIRIMPKKSGYKIQEKQGHSGHKCGLRHGSVGEDIWCDQRQ